MPTLTIPGSVTSIGDCAFEDCWALKSVSIQEGVTNIVKRQFSYCSALTDIILPDSITGIDYQAFRDCYSLTSITIPDGLTNITKFAFDGCSKTTVYCNQNTNAETALKSADIPYKYVGSETPDTPPEIIDISKAASKITVSGIVTKTYTSKALTQTNMVIKAGTTTLVYGKDYTVSYANNVNAGKATITITGINTYTGSISKTFTIAAIDITKSSSKIAVSSIVNVTYSGKAKTQPKLVVKAGTKVLSSGKDYKVTYANNMKPGRATISITGINNYKGTVKKAFNIVLPKNATYTANGLKYKVTNAATNGTGTLTLVGASYTKTNRKFVSLAVNSTVKIGVVTYNVTGIGTYAFKDYVYLKKVVIGKSIKTIGSAAFYNCKSLTTLSIGAGATTIGRKTFYGCQKLSSISIASKRLSKVDQYAFSKIAAKPTVTIAKTRAAKYKNLLLKAGMSAKAVYKYTK